MSTALETPAVSIATPTQQAAPNSQLQNAVLTAGISGGLPFYLFVSCLFCWFFLADVFHLTPYAPFFW